MEFYECVKGRGGWMCFYCGKDGEDYICMYDPGALTKFGCYQDNKPSLIKE